ncbi:hypothetical protein Tco_1341325 [Tanacetum coccineum]
MVRPETIKLQILYWTTYIEYGWSDLRLEAYDEVKHATRQYNSGLYCPVPIMAKSCTCRQLSHAYYLLGYTISSRSTALMMVATAQNTNNMTIRSERKLVHLEPLAPLPYPVLSQAVCDAYDALLDAHNEVECLMLDSMSPELQKALENYIAYDMIQELKTMFEEQAKHELFEIVKAFHACKQEEDQSVFQRRLKLPPCWLYRREESRRKKKKKPQGSKGKGKGKNKLAYDPKPKIPPPPKKEHLAKDFVCYHYEEVGH